MIDNATFQMIVDRLRELGFADSDIEWSENITPPASAEHFARETIFVICNSGMKNTVARRIYDKVRDELVAGGSAHSVFRHVGKATAIDRIWRDREDLFAKYGAADDKLAFCAGLPWIGQITKWHLAKNFGLDCAKPDVHLQRLAGHHDTSVERLCADLAAVTGYRAATIDLLLWRACAEGVIDSRTGRFGPWPRVAATAMRAAQPELFETARE
jgi:hypothetical protein